MARRLSAEALATGDPTAWFDRLYLAADRGETSVPWDRGQANPYVVAWIREPARHGEGQRAVVVGCGLGEDAEFVAGLGYDTTGFDISPAAVAAAGQRFPGSLVRYVTADLFALPADWRGAFDLVVESMTLQALPPASRSPAIAAVGTLVAPGGTLLVLGRMREAADPGDGPGPPFPLTRAEIDAVATPGLEPVRIDELHDSGPPFARRWRAVFTRPRSPDPARTE